LAFSGGSYDDIDICLSAVKCLSALLSKLRSEMYISMTGNGKTIPQLSHSNRA